MRMPKKLGGRLTAVKFTFGGAARLSRNAGKRADTRCACSTKLVWTLHELALRCESPSSSQVNCGFSTASLCINLSPVYIWRKLDFQFCTKALHRLSLIGGDSS